jgi:hypothetical protein
MRSHYLFLIGLPSPLSLPTPLLSTIPILLAITNKIKFGILTRQHLESRLSRISLRGNTGRLLRIALPRRKPATLALVRDQRTRIMLIIATSRPRIR